MFKIDRTESSIRPLRFTPHYCPHAEGSGLFEMGNTKIICTATVETNIPRWLQGSSQGWVTAEYNLLPRSTNTRIKRDKALNGGRSQEISRLIGRALRACIDLKKLKEKQIIVDCDVISADGGTRTAAINGGFLALVLCIKHLFEGEELPSIPLKNYVSAISVGLFNHKPYLDLNYEEDSNAQTDMNFVMINSNQLVEIQGTAETEPFNIEEMNAMFLLAQQGCREIFEFQSQYIGDFFPLNK